MFSVGDITAVVAIDVATRALSLLASMRQRGVGDAAIAARQNFAA
jgi:hypothetical protein